MYDIEKIKEIIYENKMQLTKKEKQLMTLFLNGLNIREISYYLKNNYTETARTIKKAILKMIWFILYKKSALKLRLALLIKLITCVLFLDFIFWLTYYI